MHDQDDSSNPFPNGGSTLRQHRHRKKVKNSLTACPPCHVVANNSSSPVTAPLRSGSDILHDDDKPPKRGSKKRGNKKWRQYRQATRKKLNLLPEILREEQIDAASPVEVLLPDLLCNKLSDASSSASSLVKDAHLGEDKGENNNYVEHRTMLTLSTLGSDGMVGSECTGSSYEIVGERLSCNGAPYLKDGPNTADSSECGGSAITEHVYSCQKSLCCCVCSSNDATTDSFFNRWNSNNSGDCHVDVEGRLTIKDENRHDGLQHGASTGLNNVKKVYHLTGVHLRGTHAEDSNDSFGSSSCCSKDATDSSTHTESVQCSSEACSSKTCLPVSSGRSGVRSRKTPSCSNLTASNRVVGTNRHRRSGKDNSVSVWQRVEKLNKESTSRAGHVAASAVQDTSVLQDTNKGVQRDPTRPTGKHTQCRKSCKQHSPDEAVEMGPTKENDALNSSQTFSRCIYKKQTPFLYQQTSLSSKRGSSQSSRNYYAPKNGIPKSPKKHSQQIEGLPMLQLVCARDKSDRSISTSSLAAEFSPTGVVSNSPTKGNWSSRSGDEKAALTSYDLDSHLVPQATSMEACTVVIEDDPHSLCLENKAISTDLDSRNLCADPCASEIEETQCVKLTTENTSQDSCQLHSAAGHMSQKWVPVGKKDIIHLDVLEASVVEASVPANDISMSANIDVQRNVSDVPASTKSENCKVATEVTARPNSSGQLDSKCQGHIDAGTAFSKIIEAVSDAYRAQQRVEDMQLLIGRPLTDFEQFVYSASPVLHCSSCTNGCNSSSQEFIGDGLCFHQTVDISLSSIWQWYEEPGCYGLEVKAHDFRRSKGRVLAKVLPQQSNQRNSPSA